MELTQEQRTKIKKVAKLVDFESKGAVSLLESIFELEDMYEKDIPEIRELIEELKKDRPDRQEIKEMVDEILSSIKIPEAINGEKGDKGDSYILTENDKKEIASKITVPVVDKIIEKHTETLKIEQPIEIIKEIAVITDEAITSRGEAIRDGLELLQNDDRLDKKAIKGLDDYDEVARLAREPRGRVVGGVMGIKEIVAGSNITVDNTNLGYPVISSTGGTTPDLQAVTDIGATTTNTTTFSPSGNNKAIIANGSGSGTGIDITHTGSGTKLNIEDGGSGDLIVAGTNKFVLNDAGKLTMTGDIEANAFITTGGTSADYVKGDGSLGTVDLSAYVPYTGATGNVNLGTNTLITNSLQAVDSGGVGIWNSFGGLVATFGAGAFSPNTVFEGDITANGFFADNFLLYNPTVMDYGEITIDNAKFSFKETIGGNLAVIKAKTLIVEEDLILGSLSEQINQDTYGDLRLLRTYGAEKVVNGTFDSGTTDWTITGTGAQWVWDAGGFVKWAGSSSSTTIQQDISVVIGETYKVEFEVVFNTTGSLSVFLGGEFGGNVSTSGQKVFFITASTTGTLQFSTGSFSGQILSLDNISVKKADGGNIEIAGSTISFGATGSARVLGDITGNARGANALDFQVRRTDDNQVASGTNSVAVGQRNRAGGSDTITIGSQNYTTLGNSTLIGRENTDLVGSNENLLLGNLNTASTGTFRSVTLGRGNTNYGSQNILLGSGLTSFVNGTYMGNSSFHLLINSAGDFGTSIIPKARLHSSLDILSSAYNSLGAEKLTNAGFTGGLTGWTAGTGWQYDANTILKNSDGTGTLSQTSAGMVTPLIAGEYYLVTIPVSLWTVGTISWSLGGTNGTQIGQSGFLPPSGSYTHQEIIRATNTNNFIITPSNNSRFRLDNLSIKRVTGGNVIGLGGGVFGNAGVRGSEQMRWGVDPANYAISTVGSTGITTFDAVGSGAKFVFSKNIELTQTVTTETVVSDRTVTVVINGTTYRLLAKA